MTRALPALITPEALELLQRIDAAISGNQMAQALRLILSNYSSFTDTALLRERTAMALAAKGRKREAASILDLVARHYAHTGQAIRSLSLIKQLQTMSVEVRPLVDHLSALYHIRSPHVQEDAPQYELEAPVGRLDLSAKEPQVPESDLFALAYDRAMDKRGCALQPQALPPLPLLSLLPQEALKKVLDLMSYEILPESQTLLAPGQAPTELLWLASPNALVRRGDDFFRLPSNSLLGLNGFAKTPSASEFVAVSSRNTEVLRLSAQAIAKLSEEMPDFANRLATLRRHALTERLICDHALFMPLPEADRVTLIERFVGLHLGRGEYMIRQQQSSPGLFIILEGQVDIVRQDDQWEITIASLGPGEVFGEIGLVSDKPAVAGVVTTAPCVLLFLSKDEFSKAAAQMPQVAKYAVNLANERLAEANATLSASDLAELE